MSNRNDPFIGAVAGALAGLIASWASKQFEGAWKAVQQADGAPAEPAPDPPTIQTADRLSDGVLGAPVPEALREPAGDLVHYLTGAGLGALYGALAESSPALTAGHGTAYGAALGLLLREGLIPVLKLAPPPSETPLDEHARDFAAHLVFGMVLEASRRTIRRAL